MALSTPGVASGLDVNAIVTQLVAVEKQPLTKLQTKATAIQSQISSWGRLQSQIDTLRTAATKLGAASSWSTTQFASADTGVATASAASTGTAAPGRYSLQVQQLAQEASLASGVIASGASLTGSLTIDLGTYDSATPPGFTPRSGSTSLTLNFTDPATSLLDVRDAINTAQAGVQATVITDGAGQRLVISSSDSGADRALRVAVSGGSAGGLNALSYDGSPASTLVQTRAARDAQFSINGLSLSASSNTLDGTVQGLKLQLLKPTTTAIDITVTNDTAGQRKLLDDFVTAYNAINAQISTDTGYDATNKKSGLFQGDATALAVRRMLRDAVGLTGTASSTLGRLSDLGVDIQRSGALSVDSTKFAAALANGSEVSKFFAAAGSGTDASKGVGLRIKDLADQLLGTDGVLPSKASALKTTLDRNQADQERVNTRVEATRARLLRQYQSLDAKMSQFTALSGYVSKQFSSN